MLSHIGYKNFKMAEMIESEIYNPESVRQRLRNLRLIFHEYMAIIKFWIKKK